jgi:hypothetical protein
MVLKSLFIGLLTLQFALAQETSPVLDPNKFTVCAITINSDDEKKIFQSQANRYPDKYNPVVELTTMGEDDWFQKACQSGVQCDQLVISGHFAGEFFGESGKKLKMKEMEEAGCSKTCEGIMNRPYEVFLFGCNTLAEKAQDHRTPAEYLQVLLDDGIPRSQAELVVQSRYGTVGDSNRSSMQRAFSGLQKQIYGFNSVGPSGKNVKGFLNNYFTKISAPAQLEQQAMKRALNQVDMGNKALADSLAPTAFSQCNSVDSEDEKTKKVCGLLDTQKTTGQKLALTMEVMAQEDYLLYLPTINSFIETVDYESLSTDDKMTFDQIKQNTTIKNQMIGLIDQTQGLGLKSDWVKLAKKLGFLSQEEAEEKLTAEVNKLFSKPLTESDANLICGIDPAIKEYINIKESGIKYKSIGTQEMYAYQCLQPFKDPDLLNRIALSPADPANPYKFVEQVILILNSPIEGYVPPKALLDRAKNQFNSKDLYLKSMGLEFVAQFEPTHPEILPQSKSFITNSTKDNNTINMGLSALAKAKIYDPEVSKVLISKFQSQGIVESSSVEYLLKASPQEESTVSTLGQFLNHPEINESNKLDIINYFKNNPTTQKKFYEDLKKYAHNEQSENRYEALEILKNRDQE